MQKKKRALVLGFTDTNTLSSLVGYEKAPIYVNIRYIPPRYTSEESGFTMIINSEEEFLCPRPSSFKPSSKWDDYPEKKVNLPNNDWSFNDPERLSLFLRVFAEKNHCEFDIDGLIRGYINKYDSNEALKKRLEKIVEVAQGH